MENNELENTLEELEKEVMDELDNPYQPYRVEFPYEVSLPPLKMKTSQKS